MLVEAFAEAFDIFAVILFVMVDDGLGDFRSEVVVIGAVDGHCVLELLVVAGSSLALLVSAGYWIVNAGVALVEVFSAHEDEELVLDDGGAYGETDGLGGLGLIFLALFHIARSGSDEVLVVVVAIDATLHLVGTGLGDRVDCASGESALTYVERSDYHLDFIDGVKGYGVCAGLAAVGSGRCEAEGIVAHGTVYLEGVVAVVGSCEGDAAFLVDIRLRGELHHIIDAAVDHRGAFHGSAAEAGACTGDTGVERLVADDGDSLELGVGFHGNIEFVRLAKFQDDVFVLHGVHTEEAVFHGVRTAGAHTVDGIASFGVCKGGVLCTGWYVYCEHRRACESLAVVLNDNTGHA